VYSAEHESVGIEEVHGGREHTAGHHCGVSDEPGGEGRRASRASAIIASTESTSWPACCISRTSALPYDIASRHPVRPHEQGTAPPPGTKTWLISPALPLLPVVST
jgi:hypothetical protein